MLPVTARYIDIHFQQPVSTYVWECPVQASIFEVQMAQPLPSDMKLEEIKGPLRIAAKWITTIERRIQQSVPATLSAPDADEGWLDSDIAACAISFFDATSDVLPAAEPYLYTAMNGDLVAEFPDRHGKLTTVIGKAAAQSFAVVDGDVLKTTLNFPFDNIVNARQDLMQITKQLNAGAHGQTVGA